MISPLINLIIIKITLDLAQFDGASDCALVNQHQQEVLKQGMINVFFIFPNST